MGLWMQKSCLGANWFLKFASWEQIDFREWSATDRMVIARFQFREIYWDRVKLIKLECKNIIRRKRFGKLSFAKRTMCTKHLDISYQYLCICGDFISITRNLSSLGPNSGQYGQKCVAIYQHYKRCLYSDNNGQYGRMCAAYQNKYKLLFI